jgi:hypothetical protein
VPHSKALPRSPAILAAATHGSLLPLSRTFVPNASDISLVVTRHLEVLFDFPK